ncbi:hypothetical protein ADEAN_000061900 [Angomonas deanei]|uniref:Uncharacterized protein n=1 Tax=Angomonas deanei TaxID=59799 RepID=A0A7G2C373_9TRYP|nr:hypothetical protein ADEAN_000061900 [Angomonas deanei]
MSAGVTAPATLEKRNDTDAGAVGACQTPIDFLRLAQTFKADGPEDVRRTYEKKIKTLCHALEKRFAPPHLVVRTTDYAALPAFHNSLEDMALLNVSPAQAIQYLHNEVLLVRNYYALLESKVGTAVPAESSFLIPGGGRVVSPNVLSEIILAQTVLLKDEYEIKVLADAFQSQCDLLVVGRNPFARDTNPTPTATIDLSEYRRHFFCGSDAPTFCGAALYGQDATSYYAILRQLSKIVFLPGLGVFSDRSKNKRRLGFTTELFAQLSFLFISDEFCRDSEQFLSQTSVDLLSQVAMEFSEKILLDTIQSIVIPFCVKRGNEYCISPKLSKYCFILLMCLLLRQKCSSIVSEAGRLVVGRLLRLYAFSLKQVSDPTTLEEETVSLQLCQLAEWRLSNITEKTPSRAF